METKVLTIGFTKKTAETFFRLIREAGVKTVLDVRQNNVSQLSGFAKKPDLAFFLDAVAGIGYQELRDLAPSQDILSRYQQKLLQWEQYEQEYINEIARRGVERLIDKTQLDHGCLLCSEDKPHHCHRRLAVEYLNSCWGGLLSVRHLF